MVRWVQSVRFFGTVGTVLGYGWYDWCGTGVRLVRCGGAVGTVRGYGWYGAGARLVRLGGTTGMEAMR